MSFNPRYVTRPPTPASAKSWKGGRQAKDRNRTRHGQRQGTRRPS